MLNARPGKAVHTYCGRLSEASRLSLTQGVGCRVSVLMVEQNATMALSIADRGYVLSAGEIVLEGSAAELLQHEDLKRAYLGR